jgi:hypothetical protein
LTPEARQKLAERLMGFTDLATFHEATNTWVDKLGAKMEEYAVDVPQVRVCLGRGEGV